MELNLENATLDEVRVGMGCTPLQRSFRRLQAFRWLYQGKSREEVTALSFFSTNVGYLHKQDYKPKVPRHWLLHQDEELREPFCEKLRVRQQDEHTDMWFCDEPQSSESKRV